MPDKKNTGSMKDFDVEQRFNNIDKRFDGLETNLASAIRNLEKSNDHLEKRFDGVDQKLSDLMANLGESFIHLEHKLINRLMYLTGGITIAVVTIGFAIARYFNIHG